MIGLTTGDDGVTRCAWAHGTALYERYHDEEWGRPVRDDRRLFERITLEAFQSGLSWLIILRKRPAFREAFADFDIAAVAEFDDDDRARLMSDARIVRNQAKINATVSNAVAAMELRERGGSLVDLLWSFAPSDPGPAPSSFDQVPASTDESGAMAAALKQRGFRFVGPTTCYALMQAAGMVNDHLLGCEAGDALRSEVPV
ncbi:MAG TPA: DNA-3-methyladenine glycosylase I [Euzebyales bacterium]|nr:DNA-3-methyladenine glycosylase I [Euzebyales bacterium]